jgi:hypothetical protein
MGGGFCTGKTAAMFESASGNSTKTVPYNRSVSNERDGAGSSEIMRDHDDLLNQCFTGEDTT